MKAELITRWDSFLRKIEARFDESLQQGEQAVLESLDDNDYDYFASLRMLSAVRTQLYESLIRKIDDTWQQQVYPQMMAHGSWWADEAGKGYRLADGLNDRMDRWYYIAEGRLSEKYYRHAIALINRNFTCTQCNAPLEIQKDFFRAQYVSCRFCNAVNTFEPDTKYAMIGWNVVDSMAALYALEEHDAMRRANRDGKTGYEQAVRRYHERYFDERIKLLPHTALTREQDIERKLKQSI